MAKLNKESVSSITEYFKTILSNYNMCFDEYLKKDAMTYTNVKDIKVGSMHNLWYFTPHEMRIEITELSIPYHELKNNHLDTALNTVYNNLLTA